MGTIVSGPLTFSQVRARLLGQNKVHENPARSNRQKFGVWYGWNGVPWCAIFMSWGFLGSTGQMGGKAASVPLLRQRFQAQGRYGSTPKVGALAIFNYDKHVEYVIGVYSSYVLTVGGNTSRADGTNYWGGEVAIKRRSRSAIKGYCYPRYAAVTAPTKPTTPTYRAYPGHAHKDSSADDSHVGKIQSRLKALGFYKMAIDSKFGDGTEAAVKAFQKSKGLTVDGVVGPKTWAALKIPA